MRLFVALDLPKEIKNYLFDIQKEVKEAKISWVAKKNLHISLKFIGEVDKSKLSDIIKLLEKIKSNKIELKLGNLGFFPSKKNPNVIWVSIKPEDLVIELQQKVDSTLLGLFSGEQKFQSHITIGKVKSIRRDKDFQRSIDNIEIKPLVFIIDSFKLMKSELKRSSPIYDEVHNVELS